MTPLDKLITTYVDYMNKWSAKSNIKKELDAIFKETIIKMQGKSQMILGEASDHLDYMIIFPTISRFSHISIELDSLHNPYRSEELYDLEFDNGTRFDNVELEKIYPIKLLDKKELKDITFDTTIRLRSLNTEFYNVEQAIKIHTIQQLEFLNRSLISRDLIRVYEAFNEETINLEMSDDMINLVMYEKTGKDKFLTDSVKDIFIF